MSRTRTKNKLKNPPAARDTKQVSESSVYSVSLKPKLNERASAYADNSGFEIPELLRRGLDILLRQNNF